MSIESPHDPRDALVRTKYFNQYPQPLERWLWMQGLPQAAERVFWLHWTEGRRHGDWCSEIPLKRVAIECCVDPSTVTRSYQLLKSLGLIHREDPGRDPNNPFCQATAITEVRLPRAFVTELGRSPNRPPKEASLPTPAAPMPAELPSHQSPTPTPPTAMASATTPVETDSTLVTPNPTPATPASPAIPGATATVAPCERPVSHPRPSREETQAMWGRASDGERTRYFLASRDRQTRLEFDPDTQLTPEDRGWILAQLAQLAIAKPTATAAPTTTPKATKAPYQGPRRLSLLHLARTRKRILDTVPGATAAEIFRQVIWAVEEGALRRFDVPLALNIAVKKIRDGAWSRPNRMPPQWMPRAELRGRVGLEQCSAA